MKRIRNVRFGWVVVGMLVGAGTAAGAQGRQAPSNGSRPPTLAGQAPVTPSAADGGRSLGAGTMGLAVPDMMDSTVRRNLDAIRANLANTERQRMLTREAAQLLQVAAELHLKLSSDASEMSPEEMLRRVDAIEKLARNVKDRMKGAR